MISSSIVINQQALAKVSDMGFGRNVVAVIFVSLLGFYLSAAGQLTDQAKWGFVALLGLLAFTWVTMASPAGPPSRKARSPASSKPQVEAVDVAGEVEVSVEDDAPPELETSTSLDGATLRERKLAKIAAAQREQDAVSVTMVEGVDGVVEVELDDVHVAGEYVVEVSPESIEDADIEVTVTERRQRHEAIRERIKRRRLGQMAEIRASTARMWEEHATGEDLVALLQTPGHGHSVMVEPEHPEPGHVYGATFIRVDEGRILKLRLPLDTGFEAVQSTSTEPELPELIGPDGTLLPLPMGPEGVPLPLPNLPSSSQALSALRDEMDN